jgi:hypothetical protein
MPQGATFMRPGATPAGLASLRPTPPRLSPSSTPWPPRPTIPIDVTFPGENEPDQVDAWISAYAEPFYIRA